MKNTVTGNCSRNNHFQIVAIRRNEQKGNVAVATQVFSLYASFTVGELVNYLFHRLWLFLIRIVVVPSAPPHFETVISFLKLFPQNTESVSRSVEFLS